MGRIIAEFAPLAVTKAGHLDTALNLYYYSQSHDTQPFKGCGTGRESIPRRTSQHGSWRRQGVCGAVLLWQTFFLIIVIPGHTRGAITLGGQVKARGLTDLVCSGCCGGKGEHSSKNAPTPQDKTNCAICFLAAHTLPAPAMTVPVVAQEALELIVITRAENTGSEACIHCYFGRAPPHEPLLKQA